MAKDALALLMSMKPKGDMGKGGESDDEKAGEDTGDSGMKKFKSLIADAFPEKDWSDDQAQAFWEAIKSCYEMEEG